VIARLRAGRADLAFTSDFIVGFPGETETDFRDTLSLIDEVGFASAYSFMYSPRPGTPAAEMNDPATPGEKSERLQRLQAAITRDQRSFLAGFAGRTLDVLLEKLGRLPGQLVGRSPYLHAVQVMAPASMIGSIHRITITEIGTNTLFGVLAERTQMPVLSTAGA
jgi:tRNA-2-methylthio-N6-dimethylallyladenosine synthase